MASGGRKYQRYGGRRKQRNTVLIVCGGETEKLYFEAFRSDLGRIRVVAALNPESPQRIVESAIKELESTKDYNQVWCVFDKDDYVCFDNALRLARQHGIKCAASNQAFELWFILHYRELTRPFHRNGYAAELGRFLGRPYSKADKVMYDELKDLMSVAIENAKKGHQSHLRDRPNEPLSSCESCTTVYQLVEELLKWLK